MTTNCAGSNRLETRTGPLWYRVVPLAMIGVLYGRSLFFGLDWDDYHFVRDYSLLEVARSFIGPWDMTGIEAPYYRPLAVKLFALRAWLLGDHPMALHALSLTLAGVVVWLFGRWLRALGLSPASVLVGSLVVVAHPVMVPSAYVWITNQMHLLQLALWLAALVIATERPDRWPVVLLLQALALLVKEDSIALPLVIGIIWLSRQTQIVNGWIIGTIVTTGVYLAVRSFAVGGIPMELWPKNLIRLPYAMIDVAGHAWQLAIFGACAVLVVQVARHVTRLWAPMAIGAAVILPHLLSQPGPTRWHLIVLAFAMLIAVIVDLSRSRLSWAAACVLLPALTLDGWRATNQFEECSASVREHDRNVLGWGEKVPEEIRRKLASKACP